MKEERFDLSISPDQRHWTDVADEMELRQSVGFSPDRVARRICRAERPTETIRAVLDEASALYKHCALFRVQNGSATVWGARGWEFAEERRANFAVSAVSGNPLELLVIHPSFRGPTPVEQAYVPFFSELGLPFPNEMMLYPVEAAGRLVGYLYADAGEAGCLETSALQERNLARRLSLGLTIVLFKQKVHALGDA